ncbi:MAG: winged helix-turn-helix transcriptional regulator [Dehalococcoidia bacterium]
MATVGRLESSREAILDILRRRDGASVDELSHELGLAGATVRRHLDVLMRDGYVSASQVRGGMGRPRYSFSITEAGAELFPHHYVRLTRRLIDEIVALGPSETTGRPGIEIANLIFEKMAERLAREYGPRVEGRTLEERVRSTARLLAEEGIDFEVAATARGVQLLGRGCPCQRLGGLATTFEGGAHGACEHDRRLLERILGASVTPLTESELPHDFVCGYRIEPLETDG